VARIGSSVAPDLAQWRTGNVEQQLSGRFTMPVAGVITDLGAFLRGVTGYGSIDYCLCLWNWGGDVSSGNALLGQTAVHTSNAAAFAIGSLTRQTWPLLDPVELDAGDLFMVGIATDTDAGSAAQWGLYSGSGTHYARDLGPPAGADWPVAMHGCYASSNALAAWVEDYDPVGSAYVRRSGAWVRADAVQVRRSGAWVNASGVQVRRSGAWNDAG
jgi:hypothetical protein